MFHPKAAQEFRVACYVHPVRCDDGTRELPGIVGSCGKSKAAATALGEPRADAIFELGFISVADENWSQRTTSLPRACAVCPPTVHLRRLGEQFGIAGPDSSHSESNPPRR
jgi:hypothetical protein